MPMYAANKQRGLAVLVLDIYIDTAFNQKLCDALSVVFAGQVEWSSKLRIQDIRFRTSSF